MEEQQPTSTPNYVIKEGEPRNDSLLKWNDEYTIPCSKNYNYHQETLNIASTTHKHSPKSLLSSLRTKNNKTKDNTFSWHQQSIKSFQYPSSEKPYKPRQKTCHTTTDIGPSLIMIGGMSGKMDCVTVLNMNKNLKRLHPLTKHKGLHPCCRWGHAASYIAPLNAIIMSGGFDSTYNWNDIRLLFLSEENEYGEWYQIETKDTEMGCRALHSSTVRYTRVMDKDKRIKRNLCEVYIFGGQYCSGGPYIYNNKLFRIQFYDDIKPLNDDEDVNGYDEVNIYEKELKAFMRADVIKSKSDALPDARSQHFGFMDCTNKRYYIYGGLNAAKEFNDLWYLDLMTKEWNKVEYAMDNVLKAPTIKALNAHNFRLNLYGDKFYYSLKQNKLLVMHSVDHESKLVRKAMIISAVKTYKEMIENDGHDVNDKNVGHDENERVEMMDKVQKLEGNVYWLYTLDLESKMWDIVVDYGAYRPKYSITGSQIHRIGDMIWMIGGRDDEATLKINRLNNIIGIKIPSIAIAWKQERIMWIGHFKNDDNKKCFIESLPKELMLMILSFLKDNTW